MNKNLKQISLSTRIITNEINKNRVKELIEELQKLEAIEVSDAEVIKAAADCL